VKPYYTVSEVAEREGVSERRIRFLCDEGRVHYCEKVGKTWLIQRNYHIDLKPIGRPRKRPPTAWKKG
jgi:hypothetical protein